MNTHIFETWRKSQKWSQQRMGEAIGADQGRISLFERGKIERLGPDQAIAAEEISGGAINRNDCLYETPRALQRAAKRRRSA